MGCGLAGILVDLGGVLSQQPVLASVFHGPVTQAAERTSVSCSG